MTTGDDNKLQAVVFHLFYIISNCVEQNKVTLEYLIHLIIYNNRFFLEKLLIKPKPFGEEKKRPLWHLHGEASVVATSCLLR